VSVDLTYRCNGCEAEETVRSVKAERVVLTASVFVVDGVAWDRTIVKTPTIESVAPEGWTVFDPYTQMTYCPACWASIERDDAPAEATA
jgi:hypothetical protein